jgi:hypothetical protein
LKFALAHEEDQSVKRNRFAEEQTIGILKEQEAGVSVADQYRKHRVSDAGIYKWKANSAGWMICTASPGDYRRRSETLGGHAANKAYEASLNTGPSMLACPH